MRLKQEPHRFGRYKMRFIGQPAFLPVSSPFGICTNRSVQQRVLKCDDTRKVGYSKTGFFGSKNRLLLKLLEAKQSSETMMTATTEFPALVQRHLGTWEGTYRIQDAKSGVMLDTHACKIEVGIRGERYSQRNTYTWDDGRKEVYEFAGRMIDGLLRVESERLSGRAIILGKDALCFYATRKDRDYQLYDVIMLLTEDTRARTWSVIEGDVMTQIIQVEETRTSRDDAYFDVKNEPWVS